MKIQRHYLILFVGFIFIGCAAAQIALEKKDLDVQTKMSDTIFFDIESELERTIYVDMRNTSNKEIDVGTLLLHKLKTKGYEITSSPKDASYILQCNILYVGKADPSAIRESLYAGYGGALAGAAAGAMIGSTSSSYRGAAYGAGIGALLGGAAELITGALVKDVTYTIITDLMISEKTSEQIDQSIQSDLQVGKGSKLHQTSRRSVKRTRYQTRIASTANKVNLKFEEALPVLISDLSRSVGGIF